MRTKSLILLFMIYVLAFSSTLLGAEKKRGHLQGLQNIGVEVNAARNRMLHIIQEIHRTEQSYLASVDVTTRFLEALDARLRELEGQVFFNHDLLADLAVRLRRLQSDRLVEEGHTFVQMLTDIVTGLKEQDLDTKEAYRRLLDALTAHFQSVPKVYLPYALSSSHAAQLLKEIDIKAGQLIRVSHKRARNEISQVLDSLQLKNSQGQDESNPLGALNSSLIAPVQRLPRYRLYMEDLVKTAAAAGLQDDRGEAILNSLKMVLADFDSKTE